MGSALGDSGLMGPVEASSESRDSTLDRTRRVEVIVDDGLDRSGESGKGYMSEWVMVEEQVFKIVPDSLNLVKS